MQTKKQKQATRRNWCKKVISGAAYSIQALLYQDVYKKVLTISEQKQLSLLKEHLLDILSSWNKE